MLLKKNYPKIKDETFMQLIQLDPTYKEGSDSAGKYGKWILNLYNKGNLREEDFYKVTDYITRFEKIKSRLQNKDIGQFKSLPELAQLLGQIEDTEEELSQRQMQRRAEKGQLSVKDDEIEILYEDDEWLVSIPKTYKASVNYGSPNWCTAHNSNDSWYKHYTEAGNLYMFLNKKDKKESHQLHLQSQQLMDYNDGAVNPNEFKDKYNIASKMYPIIADRELNKNNINNIETYDGICYAWLMHYNDDINFELEITDFYDNYELRDYFCNSFNNALNDTLFFHGNWVNEEEIIPLWSGEFEEFNFVTKDGCCDFIEWCITQLFCNQEDVELLKASYDELDEESIAEVINETINYIIQDSGASISERMNESLTKCGFTLEKNTPIFTYKIDNVDILLKILKDYPYDVLNEDVLNDFLSGYVRTFIGKYLEIMLELEPKSILNFFFRDDYLPFYTFFEQIDDLIRYYDSEFIAKLIENLEDRIM